MRHAKRLGAATLASSMSLLTTFGLAQAISSSEAPSAPSPSGGEALPSAARVGGEGPTRILVIRRSHPSASTSDARTIYVQAPPTATAPAPNPASVPAAPAPATATTRTS